MQGSERPTPNVQRPTSNWDAADQLVFGIVQGATFADLRREAAEATVAIGFDGYAIGGVSVGEPEPEMMLAVENSEPFLPNDKPRYCMGLGTPPQMIELIARGVDMFDCVLPTRLARHGTVFTAGGTLNLKERGVRARSRADRGRLRLPGLPGVLARLHPAFDQGGGDSRAAFDHAAQSPFLSRSDDADAGGDRGGNVRGIPR